MKRVEKKDPQFHQHFHCFPSIEKSSANKVPSSQKEACESFRPLYKGSNTESQTNAGQLGIANTNVDSDNREQVRETFFEKGVEAGKVQACEIVRQELETPVQLFLDENGHFENYFSKLTDRSSGFIIELALAISQKILGDHIRIDKKRLEPICEKLTSFLKNKYQLSMKLNQEDIESITQMLECVNPEWNSSTGLEISGDIELQQGKMQLENREKILERLKETFHQEFETMLSNI